jgi:hypothetical protein
VAARADDVTPFYLGGAGARALGAAGRTSRPTATTTTPPTRADDRRRQLGADDDAGRETPIRPGPLDQRVLEARDDVLVYTSEVLEPTSR